MPPKIDQGTIIILDVGKNTATSEEKGGKTFFCEAKECAARIIERKIMSQAKQYVGVLLLGSKKTANSVADMCSGTFRHIELLAELQPPTWQMIRSLPEEPSKSRGDWFDSLIVAADHLKHGVSDCKIMNRKVVLLTNFLSSTNAEDDNIEIVINGFKDDNFEIDVIGPDVYAENIKNYDVSLVRRFIEETNGTTATFDDVMRYLLFHKKKIANPMPWNVDLSIGPNVKIPVSCYIRLKDEPVVKKWMKAIKDPVTSSASTSEGIMKQKIHLNEETKGYVEHDNLIKGYHYGQKIIPFNDCDKNMLYQSGEKCLSVYGFTHASNVNWHNLNGDGLSYIFGRKGDKKAQFALRCLVECLHELNLVGIVRRVYNTGNAPKMHVLAPVIDTNNFVCLSMITICYKEDIKNMAFPPTNLKKYACSEDQVNAFKDLIKAMDLTKAYDETYDDTEAFPIAETVSPTAQYILDSIAYRAMNPGKPLPDPRDDIMMLFKVPSLIEKRSREPLEKLKTLFSLNKVVTKTKKRNNKLPVSAQVMKQEDGQSNEERNGHNDIPKIQLPTVNKINEIGRIGTMDPTGDFKILLHKGKHLNELSSQMSEAIENMVFCNLDGNYSKALDAMMCFRTECVNNDPSFYNNWLQRFKISLKDQNKVEIEKLITEKKLNYIYKNENNLSNFDDNSHEESQLYENDTIPNLTELEIQSDVNNMFDDM